MISPAFFDWFGLPTFILLAILSIWELRTKKQTPNWVGISILIVALLGIIVDSYNVFMQYIIH